MSITAFLAAIPGFAKLSPEDLEQIAERADIRAFSPGAYLIRRGEPGDTMHVITEGSVRIPLLDAEGREKSVVKLQSGDLVGEMALLTGEPRAADVIAETKVTTLVIDKATLEPQLAEHPELAGFLTEILARRLEEGAGIQRVGKYRLLGKLGEGANGKVYEALHPGLNRVVAVKMLSHSLSYNARFRDRFLEEARTVAGLSHPNIVDIFDTEAAYATYFIVMEKLSGRDLATVLSERGTLSPEETAGILKQLCDALAFAHARGFAHRDVKPANVSIDEQGHVKLMDFGLARPIPKDADGKRSKTVDGTPQYIAPETAMGLPGDGKVDIYALGVMAFEMLTGRLPFDAPNVIEILQAHVRNPAPDIAKFRPDLPPSLVEFVRGTLIKKPADRLADWPRIQRLLDLKPQVAEVAPRAEEILRIRFPPGSGPRVEQAISRLVSELGAAKDVEIARAKLEPTRR